MKKQTIATDKASKAIGPYSQGIRIGDFIYTSGQTPMDPQTGKLVDESVEKATARCLDSIKGILEAEGAGMEHIVKCVVFLKDMNDFAAMNGVYATYFPENPPARSCVQVARLPMDCLVEIEAIAHV